MSKFNAAVLRHVNRSIDQERSAMQRRHADKVNEIRWAEGIAYRDKVFDEGVRRFGEQHALDEARLELDEDGNSLLSRGAERFILDNSYSDSRIKAIERLRDYLLDFPMRRLLKGYEDREYSEKPLLYQDEEYMQLERYDDDLDAEAGRKMLRGRKSPMELAAEGAIANNSRYLEDWEKYRAFLRLQRVLRHIMPPLRVTESGGDY